VWCGVGGVMSNRRSGPEKNEGKERKKERTKEATKEGKKKGDALGTIAVLMLVHIQTAVRAAHRHSEQTRSVVLCVRVCALENFLGCHQLPSVIGKMRRAQRTIGVTPPAVSDRGDAGSPYPRSLP